MHTSPLISQAFELAEWEQTLTMFEDSTGIKVLLHPLDYSASQLA